VKKPRFTIVTATAGQERAGECFRSWHDRRGIDGCGGVIVAQRHPLDPLMIEQHDSVVVCNTPDYLGPVPAFKLGVDLALQITAPDGVIACLHDDLLIEEEAWDAKVMAFFNQHPEVGLLGFGGGRGLGAADIYQVPYDPMQLARQDFVSNMRDAEAHGRRVTVPTRVACLDGFSQIGRVEYWRGFAPDQGDVHRNIFAAPFSQLTAAGVVHHAYDAYLGGYAKWLGWQVYMLPIACHHYGGQTAVADAGYQQWAAQRRPRLAGDLADVIPSGDQYFWVDAHQKVYDLLRGVLPIRIED
jgi:hypothetical protein